MLCFQTLNLRFRETKGEFYTATVSLMISPIIKEDGATITTENT